MTALEKLRQEILRRLGTEIYLDKVSNLMDEIRVLEKEQIINAFNAGTYVGTYAVDMDADEYFKSIQKNHMSAIEFLLDNIYLLNSTNWKEILEKAKELEKKQIREAYEKAIEFYGK